MDTDHTIKDVKNCMASVSVVDPNLFNLMALYSKDALPENMSMFNQSLPSFIVPNIISDTKKKE